MINIYNTDCISYLQNCRDEAFDMILADPPYSSGGMMRSDKSQKATKKYLRSDSSNTSLLNFEGDNKDQRGYLYWSYLWMSEAFKATKEGGLFLCFTDWRQLPITTDAVQAAGFVWRGIVPWHKGIGRPMADRYSSSCEYVIWATKGARAVDIKDSDAKYPHGFFDYRTTADRIHVTEKPVNLYRHIYQILRDGSNVFDPFLGSGNSAIAAHQEGRGIQFTGTELSLDVFALCEAKVNALNAQTMLYQ